MGDLTQLAATCALGFLGCLLFYLLLRRFSPKDAVPKPPAPTPVEENKEEPKGPPCKVFFGSQTGTAEDYAGRLAKELKQRGMSPDLVDMEDFESEGMEQLAEQDFVVFVVATHGEGDPTDNAIGFYNWLISKERESDELSNVKFTVFGMGNTQYEHYNKMGRDFNEHMLRLGATPIGKYGE